jgi:TolB-like protein
MIAIHAPATMAQTTIAVFSFHMTSDTPDWMWLEKGMADRITTDLFQDRELVLVQRDTIQTLADRMQWVPEMMTDPDRLEMIRKAVRPQYVVSGTYEVDGATLTLTAMAVDIATGKEVMRRSVSGETDRVLDLLRQLSAQTLAWLKNDSPEVHLAQLPVWTRSIPAAKALYEGMDLYDQGRYAEAWRKFRAASRTDPGYAEAQYWVGKMYYFMDRYEHAREAFEEFVYRSVDHPRLGDALKEFLHTHEKVNTPDETLLSLYRDIEDRFPGVIMIERGKAATARCWLRRRRALLLAKMNRYGDAVPLVSEYFTTDKSGVTAESRQLAQPFMMRDHMLTGRTYSAEEFSEHLGFRPGWARFLRFERSGQELHCAAGSTSRRAGDSTYKGSGVPHILMAHRVSPSRR